MPSFDKTWVGYAPAPANDAGDGPSDATVVERTGRDGISYVADQTESSTFTNDMVEELRRRLREAEAREEGSGVRERPTPDWGIARADVPPAALPSTPGEEIAPTFQTVDPLADLEVDVELGAAVELEVDLGDPFADIEIEVGEPQTADELDEVMSALPQLEVALAPNSESNFYAGFDDEHPDGVFVATYTSLRADTPVYLDVYLPGGYRFRTAAIVEWVRPVEAASPEMPAGVGLKMCGLDHRMRRLIRTFARHRKPIFYPGA